MIGTLLHRVIHVRNLDEQTYILRFERNSMVFTAGQYLTAGPESSIDMREYSIYSSPLEKNYLEILIREVDKGYISKLLRKLKENDTVRIGGPFGFFLLDENSLDRNHIFIASGTGIAPFHCFATTYPKLNYTLIHGTRYKHELYDAHCYNPKHYVHCVSRETREEGADFHGRVTGYIRENPIDTAAYYYLCGNCDMIYEVYDILREAEVPAEHLSAEVYF